ncbi:RecQ family ATP-dependent DNA helicase [Sutcliffiella rhizosphaerae]|uniref:ATP-dependent DNA helicase RecQ n=1 Tax=Sutcliffiella rhizosphaerae TaxID=2880967 RepID=A0ABN8AKS5_9BACI|nr:RecQ family ATP-dependent DNA helicase [Sutcliffiella rhizosphaerae]CAG9623500.1 ATP-dependent RNA helicase DbpA [Sutcliffiella rhizosphaerae]
MNLESLLEKKTGFTTFKTGQKEIMEDVIAKKDVIALLPTGGGKSICYQIPGYVMEGTVLIVSPLLSLMEDQVQQFKANGEKSVVAINSFLSFSERERLLQLDLSTYKYIFLSPEMLQVEKWVRKLQNIKVALFVIDEAHCVSQWGHDFRTDYLKLGAVKDSLGHPPCLALTATATTTVINDIQEYLNIQSPAFHVFSLDRPNIAMKVEMFRSNREKNERLLELVNSLRSPGIVFFSSRSKVEEISEYLQENGVERVAYYHAGLSQEQRILIQQQYIHDQLDVICCTSAFGMGINKSNINYCIHYHQPTQLESYVQEIGRAGRGGDASIAILLKSKEDNTLPGFILDMELPDFEWVSTVTNDILETYGTIQHISIIPVKEWMEKFPEQESHWRFLVFHLEKYIESNGSLDQNKKSNFLRMIDEQIKNRTAYKMGKLAYMNDWTEVVTCRREMMLAYFGETLQRAPSNCCDVCGLDLNEFTHYTHADEKKGETETWGKLLKNIFWQEE